MKRCLALTLTALLCAALFGCVACSEPEEPTAAPPATTTAITTAPVNPDHPLFGAWIFHEGNRDFSLRERGYGNWTYLNFSANYSGFWEDGHSVGEFTWQMEGNELHIARSVWGSSLIRETTYTMELNGNELRLNNTLFVPITPEELLIGGWIDQAGLQTTFHPDGTATFESSGENTNWSINGRYLIFDQFTDHFFVSPSIFRVFTEYYTFHYGRTY